MRDVRRHWRTANMRILRRCPRAEKFFDSPERTEPNSYKTIATSIRLTPLKALLLGLLMLSLPMAGAYVLGFWGFVIGVFVSGGIAKVIGTEELGLDTGSGSPTCLRCGSASRLTASD